MRRTDAGLDCDPQAAAELLRALAHPMRLQILCRLLDGELSVGGFESELGLKQPNLSQQLGHLREAKLVTTRREAKSVFYSLSDQRVRGILDALREAMRGRRGAKAPVARSVAGKPAPRSTLMAAKTRQSDTANCGVFGFAGWPAHD